MGRANKVVKSFRRSYRERGQVSGRTKLGLLEKHKDYVIRARDYHSKQKRLHSLKEKARMRNPDEFYHKMISTSTKDGVHVNERNEAFPSDTIKLLKTQDSNYVNLKASQEKKKVERLQSTLHMIGGADLKAARLKRSAAKHLAGAKPMEEGADDADHNDDGEQEEEQEDAKQTVPKPRLASKVPKAKHIVFVDSDSDVKTFDAAEHFGTLPELVSNKSNRLRVADIVSKPLVLNSNTAGKKKIDKAREQSYKELAERTKRVNALERAGRELDTQRNLMGKGRRRKIGTDSLGLPIYKWAAERKK